MFGCLADRLVVKIVNKKKQMEWMDLFMVKQVLHSLQIARGRKVDHFFTQ